MFQTGKQARGGNVPSSTDSGQSGLLGPFVWCVWPPVLRQLQRLHSTGRNCAAPTWAPPPPLPSDRGVYCQPASKDKGYAASSPQTSPGIPAKALSLCVWSPAQGWPSSPEKEFAAPRFQKKEQQIASSRPPFPPVRLKQCHECARPFTIHRPNCLSLALKPTSPAPFPSLGPSRSSLMIPEHISRVAVSGPLLLLLPLPGMPSPPSLQNIFKFCLLLRSASSSKKASMMPWPFLSPLSPQPFLYIPQ